LQIDDVVDATPVHFFGGCWGLIAAGLFTTKLDYGAIRDPLLADECSGVFYGGSGGTLAANIILGLAIVAWVGASSMVVFIVTKLTLGVRVSKTVELVGMDDSKHGGQSFPEISAKAG
ncbi:unnamed protein product, partial [Discosporangium mesarthrocarpum]